MRIVDNHFNSIIDRLNEVFDFKLLKEHMFSSLKAHGFNGLIKEYYDKNVGVASVIKTRTMFWNIKTYSCIISPIGVDGPTCFIEYHIKRNICSLQIKIYDTLINADNDYKIMKSKMAIVKARYSDLVDSKINDLDNEDIVPDLSIGKKVFRKEAGELIKISNSCLNSLIDFIMASPKVGSKAKTIRINKFLGYELKNDGYLFNSLRKVYNENRANEYIKELFVGSEN